MNRTIVNLVAAQTIARAEAVDLTLGLPLLAF
jgi:hypothetical protein